MSEINGVIDRPDYLAPLWILLAEGKSEQHIQTLGREINAILESQIADISRQKKILDDILGWKAPVAVAWETLTETPAADPFHDAVKDTLNELVVRGIRKVTTDMVYQVLSQRGFQNGRKNPKTAIGNIVPHFPGWRRTGKGIYEFQLVGNSIEMNTNGGVKV